jgi:hypothetical protein
VLIALLMALVWLLFVVTARPTQAQEAFTEDDVHAWIDAYAWSYETASYPHDDLVVAAERVARCESDRFDERVINNARRGRLGEVGTFQFLPGPRSIFWSTPSAAHGWDYWDPEANVAGAVFLISRGYGPRHWSCW